MLFIHSFIGLWKRFISRTDFIEKKKRFSTSQLTIPRLLLLPEECVVTSETKSKQRVLRQIEHKEKKKTRARVRNQSSLDACD